MGGSHTVEQVGSSAGRPGGRGSDVRAEERTGRVAALSKRFQDALDNARLEIRPFRHRLLEKVLTDEVCTAIVDLPLEAPSIGDTRGKRETHNSSRAFFSVENRRRFPVCQDMAGMLQGEAAVRALEATCGIVLRGSFLRIEYCQDRNGFWLEPHTDIGAKRCTLQVYLSAGPGAEHWGTDLYDGTGNLVAVVPGRFNSGLLFVPAADSWHGFRGRPINGIRRSLIVNYVNDDWRSRHELAFPDQPVA